MCSDPDSSRAAGHRCCVEVESFEFDCHDLDASDLALVRYFQNLISLVSRCVQVSLEK